MTENRIYQANEAFNFQRYFDCIEILTNGPSLVNEDNNVIIHKLLAHCYYNIWLSKISINNLTKQYELWDPSIGFEISKEVDNNLVNASNSFKILFKINNQLDEDIYRKYSHVLISQGYLIDAYKLKESIDSDDLLNRIIYYSLSTRVYNNTNSAYKIIIALADDLQEKHGHIRRFHNYYINLKDLYLHCAEYYLREHKRVVDETYRAHLFSIYKSLVVKAFDGTNPFEDIHRTNLSSELWIEMGIRLMKSPFVLVAEDSLWIAYIRNPLLEEALRLLLTVYSLTNRLKLADSLIRSAHSICRINLLCRSYLRNRDESYEKIFRFEEVLVTKIQATSRGYIARRQFVIMKPKLIAFRNNYNKIVKKLERIKRLIGNRETRSLLRRWFMFSIKAVDSCIIIQKYSRRWLSIQLVRSLIQRVIRANRSFLEISLINYNYQRVCYLRRWYDQYIHSLRTRSIKVLIHAIRSNYCRAKVRKHLQILTLVIRRRQSRKQKHYFSIWSKKCEQRVISNARRIIYNFFKQIKHVKIVQKVQDLIKNSRLLENIYKLKYSIFTVPLMRDTWRLWIEAIAIRRIVKAKKLICQFLTNRFYSIRYNQIVKARRRKLEIVLSLTSRAKYKRTRRYYRLWLYIYRAVRLQCFCRQWLSRKAARRLRIINAGIKRLIHQRKFRFLDRYFTTYWKRGYMSMIRYQKFTAATKIISLIKRYYRRTRIKRFIIHKYQIFHFVSSLHTITLGHYMRRLRHGTYLQHQINVLKPFVRSIRHISCRYGFRHWYKHIRYQRLMQDIVGKFVNNKLDETYWPGCYLSAKIIPSEKDNSLRQMNISDQTSTVLSNFLSNYVKPKYKLSNNGDTTTEDATRRTIKLTNGSIGEFYRWEIPVSAKSTTILLSSSLFRLLKAFRIITSIYRVRKKLKRIGGRILAKMQLPRLLVDIRRRRLAVSKIHSRVRIRQAFNLLTIRKNKQRILCEISRKIGRTNLYKIFEFLLVTSVKRRKSRLTIQMSYRCYRSRCITTRLTVRKKQIDSVCEYLSTSLFQKKLISMAYARMQLIYSMKMIRYHDPLTIDSTIDSSNRNHIVLTDIQSWKPRNRSMNYISKSFHNSIYHIKQSGIFVLSVDSGLSDNEIVHCCSISQIVLVERVTDKAINLFTKSFSGDKIILSEGLLTVISTNCLVGYLFRTYAIDQRVCLHISCKVEDSSHLCYQLRRLPIHELCIDTKSLASFDSLLIVNQIVCNNSLKSFTFINSSGFWLASTYLMVESLLQSNIRDVRLLNCAVDRQLLFRLLEFVTINSLNDFHSLELLVNKRNQSMVDSIMKTLTENQQKGEVKLDVKFIFIDK